MTTYVDILVWSVALPILLLALFLALQIILGLKGKSRFPSDPARRPRLLVLVPAHDEEAGIPETIASIRAELEPDDELLVVADNCRDRTAEVARKMGATVLVREDAGQFGKGYALAFALDHLEDEQVEVVGFIDADTSPRPGAVRSCAQLAAETGRPVQGTYLLGGDSHALLAARVNQFAVWVQNVVRQRGRARLGMGSLLNGSGFFMPLTVAREISWSRATLAEDTEQSLELLLAGHATQFLDSAVFTSLTPDSEAKVLRQRSGWMIGRTGVARRLVPRLFWEGLRQGRPALLMAGLDALVPPTSLLLLGSLMAGGLLGLIHGKQGQVVAVIGAGSLVLSLLAAWLSGGKHLLGAGDLPGLVSLFLQQGRRWLLGVVKKKDRWKDYRGNSGGR